LLLFVFIAYQVSRAILGGTWETENILTAALGIILAGMFTILSFLIHQNRTLGILEERTKNLGDSLIKLGTDFKEHAKS